MAALPIYQNKILEASANVPPQGGNILLIKLDQMQIGKLIRDFNICFRNPLAFEVQMVITFCRQMLRQTICIKSLPVDASVLT
jgi:hypothetical protein